jgi:hypothetical protein
MEEHGYLFVVGNFMRGLPLSQLLVRLKAQFECTANTSPGLYRMMLFGGAANGAKDCGLSRVVANEISVKGKPCVNGEVWIVPQESWSVLLLTMDPSLTIGWVRLEDFRRPVLGFLLESFQSCRCVDITEQCKGSWMNFGASDEVMPPLTFFQDVSFGDTSPSEGDVSPWEGEVSPLLVRRNSTGQSSEESQARPPKERAVRPVKEPEHNQRALMDRWSHLTPIQRDRLVRSKIPDHLISEFWMRISGADKLITHDIFEQLSQTEGIPEIEHKISKDVPRTLQAEIGMQDPDIQNRLTAVLHAYSLYDPRVGYCQVSKQHSRFVFVVWFLFSI